MFGATEMLMRESGKLASGTDKAAILLQSETHMSESTLGAKRKGSASITGVTEIHTLVNSSMDKSTDKATGKSLAPKTPTNTKAHIWPTKSTVTENSFGQQAPNIRAVTFMTPKKDMVRCIGSMDLFIGGFGTLVCSLGWDWWYSKMVLGRLDSSRIIFTRKPLFLSRSFRSLSKNWQKRCPKLSDKRSRSTLACSL